MSIQITERRNPRLVWSFSGALLVASLGLNWPWEMVQMRAYVEMATRSWSDSTLTCTVATLGDGVITLGIYGVTALAKRRFQWGLHAGWKGCAAVALLGAACAVAIEKVALTAGCWSYNEQMPIVPVLNVGLWPLLQLTLLVPIALWIAGWWGRRVLSTEATGGHYRGGV